MISLPQLIKQTKLMEEELDMDRNSVLNRYAFNKHKDARVTIFSKVILVQRSIRCADVDRPSTVWTGLTKKEDMF
ncbi:MAG: hypothetical protein WB988_20190 [Candidatus Nitrosopolaris sp.]|jgi:hypothetical protein